MKNIRNRLIGLYTLGVMVMVTITGCGCDEKHRSSLDRLSSSSSTTLEAQVDDEKRSNAIKNLPQDLPPVRYPSAMKEAVFREVEPRIYYKEEDVGRHAAQFMKSKYGIDLRWNTKGEEFHYVNSQGKSLSFIPDMVATNDYFAVEIDCMKWSKYNPNSKEDRARYGIINDHNGGLRTVVNGITKKQIQDMLRN